MIHFLFFQFFIFALILKGLIYLRKIGVGCCGGEGARLAEVGGPSDNLVFVHLILASETCF